MDNGVEQIKQKCVFLRKERWCLKKDKGKWKQVNIIFPPFLKNIYIYNLCLNYSWKFWGFFIQFKMLLKEKLEKVRKKIQFYLYFPFTSFNKPNQGGVQIWCSSFFFRAGFVPLLRQIKQSNSKCKMQTKWSLLISNKKNHFCQK